jgi:methylamine--corrinoid protein Co-methyltransferase
MEAGEPHKSNPSLHGTNILLTKYDKKEYYKTAPEGKRFQECYDVMAIEPTREHLNVYQKAMQKLEQETGLQLS